MEPLAISAQPAPLTARQDATQPRQPRQGTKLALLRSLLAQTDGCTIDSLTVALGWQPHTVRAALTRLRQAGLSITTSKTAETPTRYRLQAEADTSPVTSPALAEVGAA